jgi:hypothetical protein
MGWENAFQEGPGAIIFFNPAKIADTTWHGFHRTVISDITLWRKRSPTTVRSVWQRSMTACGEIKSRVPSLPDLMCPIRTPPGQQKALQKI